MVVIKILIIFVLMLALLISTLLFVQKSYALKEVEANYVYYAISTILNDSHSVKINEKNYTIDSRIIDALHLFPEYFKGGLIGPSAFPDMYIGQGLIHPDTRCQNGQEVEWQHCRSGTFSYEWLRHIYDSGWEYYDIRNADNESQKAIAFTYGILTHAAKDMWFNTLVNEFSRGIFPIPTSNQTDVNSSLVNVIRHVIISSYIKKHSPFDNTILEMKSPKDFIFRTFIEDKFYDSTNKTSKGLGRGYLVDYLVDLRDRLVQKSNYYKNVENIINNSTKEKEIAQSKKEYLDAWIKHVNLGLYEWPQMSQDVAHAIFVENNNYDRAKEVIQNFVTDHLLAMFGNSSVMERNEPKMNRIIASIGDIQGFVKSQLEPMPAKVQKLIDNPLQQFEYYNINSTSVIDTSLLKDIDSNPEKYIDGNTSAVSIDGKNIKTGFQSNTSEKLDRLMGIQNGVSNPQAKFDPNRFAPAKNTITLTKLLLLDPETLNQLLKDKLSTPVYSSADNGFGQDNAMLDYIRSLDANHQWRVHSIRQGDIGEQEAGEGEGAEISAARQHSEGMPIWMDCLARQRVFRVIFTDWENGNFPNLGEGCMMAKDITVTFLNLTASEIGHPSSLDGISNMDFIVNNKLLTYSGAKGSSIFSSASSMSLPKGVNTTTVTRDRLIVGAVLHHELLQGCVPIRGFSHCLPPLRVQVAHSYDVTNNNFHNGTYTDKAVTIGWDRFFRQHAIIMELTYLVKVKDYEAG